MGGIRFWCHGIYCTLKVSWAGVTLNVGSLALRYLLPVRDLLPMSRGDASPKCRRDSCASVPFGRSRRPVPEGRLAYFLATLAPRASSAESMQRHFTCLKVVKRALTRRGKHVAKIIADTRALERNQILLGPIARSRKKTNSPWGHARLRGP